MTKRILIGFVVVLLALYGFGFTRTAQIRTEIEIDATPEAVWNVLTDFAAYPDWNPFVRQVRGEAVEGATLDNVIQAIHLENPQTFRPTVLVARENEELRWLGHLLVPGLFDGEHYFIIAPSETGTHFTHGENFRGLLLLAFDMTDFVPSFEALNAALKARVEENTERGEDEMSDM